LENNERRVAQTIGNNRGGFHQVTKGHCVRDARLKRDEHLAGKNRLRQKRETGKSIANLKKESGQVTEKRKSQHNGLRVRTLATHHEYSPHQKESGGVVNYETWMKRYKTSG